MTSGSTGKTASSPRRSARLRVAKFKDRSASIEGLDYRTARGLRKEQLLELGQNRWITAHQSILITGPSGSGKSFVAQALGQHAGRCGYSAQYLRLPTLLNLFVQARAEGTYDRLLKRLSKIAVILIDDFGLASLADREFVAGDYSIADMASYPWIVPRKRQQQNLDDCPHLKRWFETIRARPAIARFTSRPGRRNRAPALSLRASGQGVLQGVAQRVDLLEQRA